MKKFMIANKSGISISINNGRETRTLRLLPNDWVGLEVEGSDLYATIEGKRYLTDDHAGDYIRMGWIIPEEDDEGLKLC